MTLERRSASQVCTFTPQRPSWSFQLSGGGIAGSWAGAFAGQPYIVLGAAQSQSAQAGDVLRLYTGANLKEPTLFTVQAVSAPGFGFVNLFIQPPPQTSPTSSDTATSIPRPAQARWLGAIGHVSQLKYSTACPGGPDAMSCLLRLPPDYRTDALNPGRVVQIWRGANCVWEGKLDEPKPSTEGWNISAHGAGNYGTDFAAVYTTWNADDPVNQAIARGMRWLNPGIGSPAGIYLGQKVDSGSHTVTQHLQLICNGGALLWSLQPPGASVPPAGPWKLNIFPLPQDVNGRLQSPNQLLLISHSPVPRTIAADINTLVIRYQKTADIPATAKKKAVPATYATVTVTQQASVIKHGPMEYYLDVSSAGVMTAAAVTAIGNNILSKYVRASWSDPFTVGPGQLLNAGGYPVDLGCQRAAYVVQLLVADAPYGGEVVAGPISFMIGKYEFDDDSDTATITPLQTGRMDMATLISSLYPGKFT